MDENQIDSLEEQLAQLKRNYLLTLPTLQKELQENLQLAQQNDNPIPHLQKAQSIIHRLHGTAGSYRLYNISNAAKQTEFYITPTLQAKPITFPNEFWDTLQKLVFTLCEHISIEIAHTQNKP